MNIPTVKDYEELYNELVVHCEFFEDKREPYSPIVLEKMTEFYTEFSEFLNKSTSELGVITYGQWMVLSMRDPYHSNDIRRIAEQIYILCEEGITCNWYHENLLRDVTRARANREGIFRFNW